MDIVQDGKALSPDNLSGMTIGKYRLEQHLHTGGMAYVYKGVHVEFGLPIAVKVLFPELYHLPKSRERFRREATLQFRLQHPNIVRVFDIIDEQGILAMVMDWVEGPSLEDIMRDRAGPLPVSEIKAIILPLLKGLGYAHQHKIIHRDIKPGNILLEGEPGYEVPKLMDFGIAKILDGGVSITKAGLVLGTPLYLAPELAVAHKNIDHRVDIYALGVTLYQLLTGRLPFEMGDPISVMRAHCMKPVPPLSTWLHNVNPQLEVTMQRALAKRASERFANCREFSESLERSLGNGPYYLKDVNIPYGGANDSVPGSFAGMANHPAAQYTSTPNIPFEISTELTDSEKKAIDLFQEARLRESLTEFQQIIELNPQHTMALSYRKTITELLEWGLEPGSVGTTWGYALQLYHFSQYQEAYSWASSRVQQNPSDSDSLNFQSLLSHKLASTANSSYPFSYSAEQRNGSKKSSKRHWLFLLVGLVMFAGLQALFFFVVYPRVKQPPKKRIPEMVTITNPGELHYLQAKNYFVEGFYLGALERLQAAKKTNEFKGSKSRLLLDLENKIRYRMWQERGEKYFKAGDYKKANKCFESALLYNSKSIITQKLLKKVQAKLLESHDESKQPAQRRIPSKRR